MLTNWAGNIEFSASGLYEPSTVEELQDLVRRSPHVRALGSGHSFNRIADTTGALVSTRKLELPIVVDQAAATVSVPGGLRFAEVAYELEAQGFALHNLGSLPHISVAGACATGTHGSGDANRNLASAAVAIEFVQGDGELVRVDLADASFAGSVLSLGALGIVTRLELAVVPTFELRQDVYLDLPLAIAEEHVLDILADGYSVSLFSTFARNGIIDQIWRKSIDETAPDDLYGARAATVTQHPVPGADASAASPQQGERSPWHAVLPHFRVEHTPSSGEELQSEYFLPRHVAGEVLIALHEVADSFAGALQVFEMRSIAADDLWLSPCRGRDTVAAHFTWVADLDVVRPALSVVEAALAPYDARPHWAKVFLAADRDRFHEIYPDLGRFTDLAEHHDPQRCFGNEFLQRYVYGD